MAVISQGRLNTLYALERQAGLQPGSVSPVLRQLSHAGLIDRATGGKRRRRVMHLTDYGMARLETDWMGSLDPTRELESILRGVAVALLHDNYGAAAEHLHVAADVRSDEARNGPALNPARSPLAIYAALKAEYVWRRSAWESDLLRDFSYRIGALISGPITGSGEI